MLVRVEASKSKLETNYFVPMSDGPPFKGAPTPAVLVDAAMRAPSMIGDGGGADTGVRLQRWCARRGAGASPGLTCV